jgi:hypothetical protein
MTKFELVDLGDDLVQYKYKCCKPDYDKIVDEAPRAKEALEEAVKQGDIYKSAQEVLKNNTPVCLTVPGVGTPDGFQWARGYDGSSIEKIIDSHKKGLITCNNGDNTLSAGYKYVALTITEGTGCGHYYLFGKTLPTKNKYVADEFCSYGQLKAGIKPDTKCVSVSRKAGQPGGTSWKIYPL